ncbi:protein FAM174C-like [Myxocyprinus asiaticus]|uniref:protein FAM174C-like n=1 Tax=Myxocyprinus asiaticus TaxID=70543 RepID=UPI002222C441|nr:protein FAM174C-like [Myxocyprinus asiaticus]
MTPLKVLLLLLALWASSFADDTNNQPQLGTTKSLTTKNTSSISISPDEANKNNTSTKRKSPDGRFSLDGAMINRALYVLIGITAIGVLYFLVRAVRLKKTSVQRKKYGLLSNYEDTMEMAHLESDEEDTTVYEAKSLRR